MKYDVVIVGGGPGGLVAAKTAAENGLRALLIERKKNLKEVNRTCGQTFFLAGKYKGATESGIYCYRDPAKVEIGPTTNRFVYPQGFAIEYKGPIVPYYNTYHFSPSGYRIGKYPDGNEDPYGFFYDKETLLACLLAQTEKAGAEVWQGTVGMRAEDSGKSVRIVVSRGAKEDVIETSYAVAADSNNSVIVDSLGLNGERPLLAPPMKVVGYVIEGVKDYPRNCWLSFCIPSISPRTDILMYMVAGGRMMVVGGPAEGSLQPKVMIEKFMKHPTYIDWFKHAKIYRETACTIHMRLPLKVPAVGRVVVVGDAGAPYETLIQGAMASGYLAIKAIKKESNGQNGYAEYINWWQNAFEFNDPTFFKTTARYMFMNTLCTDEDVDYLYKLFTGWVGVSQLTVARNLELVKDGRPELYNKLKEKGVDRLGLDIGDVWKGN